MAVSIVSEQMIDIAFLLCNPIYAVASARAMKVIMAMQPYCANRLSGLPDL